MRLKKGLLQGLGVNISGPQRRPSPLQSRHSAGAKTASMELVPMSGTGGPSITSAKKTGVGHWPVYQSPKANANTFNAN